MEHIKTQVQAYFDKNAHLYITDFLTMSEDNKAHIVNIGTSIICTRHNIGYAGGSFVQSVVANDLRGTYANADGTNLKAIRFYLMMMHNMPVTI